MKIIKKFAIIILMITIFLIILGTKVQATTENIQENKNYTLKTEIQIRIMPLMNSTKISTISGDIKVTEIMNDWCKIENHEHEGWVRINSIKSAVSGETENVSTEPIVDTEVRPEEDKVPEVETTKPEEDEKEEETVKDLEKIGYVDADGLKIRKEPNTSSKELHSLSRNDKVNITGQIGNWYRIEYNGEEAYVSAKYISDKKTVETTSRGDVSREENKVEDTEGKVEQQPKEEAKEEPKKEETSNLGQQIVDYAKKYIKKH